MVKTKTKQTNQKKLQRLLSKRTCNDDKNILHVGALQYGCHQPLVVTEHVKYGW